MINRNIGIIARERSESVFAGGLGSDLLDELGVGDASVLVAVVAVHDVHELFLGREEAVFIKQLLQLRARDPAELVLVGRLERLMHAERGPPRQSLSQVLSLVLQVEVHSETSAQLVPRVEREVVLASVEVARVVRLSIQKEVREFLVLRRESRAEIAVPEPSVVIGVVVSEEERHLIQARADAQRADVVLQIELGH